MIDEDSLPVEFLNAVDRMITNMDIKKMNMIREIQIKGTIEWLENTEDGYVVKSIANNLGITCRKVAEMIVDKVV